MKMKNRKWHSTSKSLSLYEKNEECCLKDYFENINIEVAMLCESRKILSLNFSVRKTERIFQHDIEFSSCHGKT